MSNLRHQLAQYSGTQDPGLVHRNFAPHELWKKILSIKDSTVLYQSSIAKLIKHILYKNDLIKEELNYLINLQHNFDSSRSSKI